MIKQIGKSALLWADAGNDIMMCSHIKTGTDIYFSTNALLRDILSIPETSMTRKRDGRMRVQLAGGGRHRIYPVSDVAYCCYNGLIRSIETWEVDVDDFRKWKDVHAMTIDHCDGNPQNNTVYNLSIMDRSINSSKGSLTKRFLSPVSLLVAYSGGKYRLQIAQTLLGGIIVQTRFQYDTAGAFLRALQFFRLRAKELRDYAKNALVSQDIAVSIWAQRELASLPDDTFAKNDGSFDGILGLTGIATAYVLDKENINFIM